MVKWRGYPDKADWTEEPYENFEDKRLLKKYHMCNPEAPKDVLGVVP